MLHIMLRKTFGRGRHKNGVPERFVAMASGVVSATARLWCATKQAAPCIGVHREASTTLFTVVPLVYCLTHPILVYESAQVSISCCAVHAFTRGKKPPDAVEVHCATCPLLGSRKSAGSTLAQAARDADAIRRTKNFCIVYFPSLVSLW